jgi:predicted ATPase with chaperone activity
LGESSESVRQRVEAAREKQRKRFDGVDGLQQDVACNADMGGKEHRYRRVCVKITRFLTIATCSKLKRGRVILQKA